ncbi:MAG: nucleotide exchange factor GrpE, partial [bacterium]
MNRKPPLKTTGSAAHQADLRDPLLPPEAEDLAAVAEESENADTASDGCLLPEDELRTQLDAALHDLRLERASFATYRQRVDKEKSEIRQYAAMDLARDLIRVVDYLEMSLQFDLNDIPANVRGILEGV